MTGFKREALVFLGVAVLTLGTLYFLGCATTAPQQTTKSPEEVKAYQDSLDREQTKKLNLLWSFGYEPYKQKDYARAKKYFKQVAELDTAGKFGKVLYQRLGNCYLQLGQSDSAEWAYKTGIHNRPDEPYPYKALIYIYNNSGKSTEAIDTYRKLIKIEPDSAKHHKELGKLLVSADKLDEAVESLGKSVELNPNDREAQDIYTSVLTQFGPEKLLEQQIKYVQQFPEDMVKRRELAETYLKLGEPAPAAESLVMVTTEDPQNLVALELLGEAYNQLEQYQNAANTYEKIVTINPEDKKNLSQQAIALRMLGQYSKAMRQVNKALSIDSKYGLAHIARGLVFETAADACQKKNKDGKILFDDKLVYEQAYHAYRQATSDPMFASDARRYMEVVKSVIPESSDLFMNKNQNTPRNACYDWTLSFWREVSR